MRFLALRAVAQDSQVMPSICSRRPVAEFATGAVPGSRTGNRQSWLPQAAAARKRGCVRLTCDKHRKPDKPEGERQHQRSEEGELAPLETPSARHRHYGATIVSFGK
jgi:hypothetical protein